jgi:glycosyltransferase involved in cell wall biosynthesis
VDNRAERKRILILTDDFGGGTGNHLLSMIRRWDKSKWEVKIVSQVRRTARVTPDVPVVRLPPLRTFEAYPVAQIRRLFEIRRLISRERPEIVHAYFFWSIIYARLLKRSGAIRFLIENREDQGFNWGRHEYALLRLTRSLPDRVICVSNAVRETVLEREKLDPGRTLVIHNGIEQTRRVDNGSSAIRRRWEITEGNPVVGMVANLNRSVKGVEYFLDAVPSILEAVPETRFIVLGRGREERLLKEKARRLGIDSYVIFAGYQEEVERYYSIMDISVLTSLSEGLSITLLESMNYGLPVVVTRVGGNPELVVDGQTGYLVPPRDPASFAARVVELLRNPGLRSSMGEAGYRRIRESFRIDDVASRYLNVYDGLLR